MGKSKVSTLAYVPPDDVIDYFYNERQPAAKPDRYTRDAQWDGPDKLVITTYGKGDAEGQRWVKVLTCRAGVEFEGVQVFSPAPGENDTSPFERVLATYYIVGSTPIVWGGNMYPSHEPPSSGTDALSRRCVWVCRVPLRPAV
jgi:hypothetical protein